jgi:2-dehydropantoate 2-reductase
MRIAVVGAGGIGGYYGGLLARQHEVILLARGPHLQAIRESGLRVKSPLGDFVVRPEAATDDAGGMAPVDLLLFCTKTYDTDEAARRVLPLIGEHTAILSLQNGVDAADRIGSIAGMQHMLAGTTWISSAIESPGVIRRASAYQRVAVGELDGETTDRVTVVHDAFSSAGVTAELSRNILAVLWSKFIFIAAAAGIGSLTRLPVSEFRSVPETRRMILGLMNEADAVARGLGVNLPPDAVDQSLDFMDHVAPGIRASMQLDVEAGHRTELESLIGVIGRLGRQQMVPTPIADTIYASLLPIERAARQVPRPQ